MRKGYLKIHFAVDMKTGQAVSMDATSEKVGDGRRLRRLVGDAERQLEFARELAFGVMPAIQLQDYGAKLLEAEGFRGDLDSPSRIPEGFVRRTFLLEGPDEAIGRLEEYARAGVDEMLLHFMDERSEREFARRVIPYFRDGELAR